MKTIEKISPSELRELLSYEKQTGCFTWNKRLSNRASAGANAGHKNSMGYVQIKIHGRIYAAHRLAWLWMTGEWPAHQIDHVDGVRHNNRIENLRCVTGQENATNLRLSKSNTTGLRGAYLKKSGKWGSQISMSGKIIGLGQSFPTAEEAHKAYLEARSQLYKIQPVPRELVKEKS